MLTKVQLHGALADDIGRAVWHFEIDSLVEIFRALEANTGKAIDHLCRNLNVEYRFVVDGKDLNCADELVMRRGALPKEVHIMPVLQGAGSGSWFLVIGLALIAAVLFAPVATAAAGTTAGGATGATGLAGYTAFAAGGATLTTVGSIGLMLGATLALSGLSQLLYKTPAVEEGNERPENKPSYLFNGAVNTYRQGNPVPLGFGGPLTIGSQVISAGVRAVDISQEYEPSEA